MTCSWDVFCTGSPGPRRKNIQFAYIYTLNLCKLVSTWLYNWGEKLLVVAESFLLFILCLARVLYIMLTRSHDFPRLIGFSSTSAVQWPAHKRNGSIFSRLFYLNFSLCANECFKQNYKTIVIVVVFFFFSPMYIVWCYNILCVISKQRWNCLE